MEHFESKALNSASNPPRFWFRFVDDTFVIHQQAHKQLFLDHINSIVLAIKFTVKDNQENGAIPFLDTLVKTEANNSLSITVYQKPTHHNLSAKYSVIGTLTRRAKTVCTTTELLNAELKHLREAVVMCKYPRWAINKIQNKFTNNQEEDGVTGFTLSPLEGVASHALGLWWWTETKAIDVVRWIFIVLNQGMVQKTLTYNSTWVEGKEGGKLYKKWTHYEAMMNDTWVIKHEILN